MFEGDGYLPLYKRLSAGRFQWPRNKQEAMALTQEQFDWLMQGMTVVSTIRQTKPERLCRPGQNREIDWGTGVDCGAPSFRMWRDGALFPEIVHKAGPEESGYSTKGQNVEWQPAYGKCIHRHNDETPCEKKWQ